jgi:protein SCO1
MNARLLIVIGAGFLAGAIAAAGVLALNQSGTGPKLETSGTALIGGPFTLLDQNGKTVTDKDFRGRLMLVFFGFTHCPDICPAELQVMSASVEALGDKAADVIPIFITLDPERDTPAVMADYVKNFGSRLVGLTGSPEAIAAAAKAFRVAYAKVQNDPKAGDYSVDHSEFAYLMGRDGQYVTHFPYGTPVEKVTETLRRSL